VNSVKDKTILNRNRKGIGVLLISLSRAFCVRSHRQRSLAATGHIAFLLHEQGHVPVAAPCSLGAGTRCACCRLGIRRHLDSRRRGMVAEAFPSAPPGSDEEMSAVWLASRKSSVSSEARAHILFGVAERAASMSWFGPLPPIKWRWLHGLNPWTIATRDP
jgi:hypothetical protein